MADVDGEDPGDGLPILRSQGNEARVDKYPVRHVTRETRRYVKEANSEMAPEVAKKDPAKVETGKLMVACCSLCDSA